MLSSIGRAAIRRVGAGPSPVSTNRVYQSAWCLQRANASDTSTYALPRAQFAISLQRSYATTTKSPQSAPTKATTAKAGRAKKAAPKKVAKKPVAKKIKKKVAAKAKPKPKAKAKKVLTPEQKGKAELKSLKATALVPPPTKPSSVWTVLLKEFANDTSPSSSSKGLSSFSKAAAAKYRSLSPEELEQYNHKASQNKLANNIALKEWTESHTPEEIRLANNARILLKKRTGKRSSFPPLQDARLPKRNKTPFLIFVTDRWASGDLKGVKVTEASLLLRREYLALSDADRKGYEDRAGAERQRYIQEFKTVFRRDPGNAKKSATT